MKRRQLLMGGSVLAAGLLLGGHGPTATALDLYAGAEDHYAGSQIGRVEGLGTLPEILYSGEDQLIGHDVSGHQGPVDWGAAAGAGAKFVYAKATEGTGFVNPQFPQQYNGSFAAGLVRGAYHFARPDVSSGADQANYFIAHGGGWSKDGRTLPGALDAEYNPYGETCYNLDPVAMVAWLHDFSDTYRARTGRYPAIYTSANWWKRCTANSPEFWPNPLWIARYNSSIGELPKGWTTQTIWQFANAGTLPGDQDWFNGNADQLRALALG